MSNGGYDRALVETLAPTIWDQKFAWGMVDEMKPDPAMPKGTVIPKWGSTLYAHLADIRRAWELEFLFRFRCPERDCIGPVRQPSGWVEARALYLVAGLGLSHAAAAVVEGVSRQAISYRYERAIGMLVGRLNGVAYSEEELED